MTNDKAFEEFLRRFGRQATRDSVEDRRSGGPALGSGEPTSKRDDSGSSFENAVQELFGRRENQDAASPSQEWLAGRRAGRPTPAPTGAASAGHDSGSALGKVLRELFSRREDQGALKVGHGNPGVGDSSNTSHEWKSQTETQEGSGNVVLNVLKTPDRGPSESQGADGPRPAGVSSGMTNQNRSGTVESQAYVTGGESSSVVPQPLEAAGVMGRLIESLTQQTRATGENTAVLGQTSASFENLGRGLASQLKAQVPVLSSKGTSLLGLSPLVSLLTGLFRRKHEEPPPELPTFELPGALHLEQATSRGSAGAPVTYDSSGLPRSASPQSTPSINQVTVTIQALDARSVLDRSGEIAAALRSAMLHSHPINDALAEME